MISPTNGKDHVVSKTADGVIVVDGKPYPMAEDLVATEAVIQQRMRAVAQQLADVYKGLRHRDTHTGGGGLAPISDENPLIVISILKGSYIFTADMVRYLGDCGLPHVVDFMRVSSYRGTKTTGDVQLIYDMRFRELRGKHVLILEDIADTGSTLKYLLERIQREHEPASLKVCVLADKPEGRKVSITPDYVCLTVPNKYVIGYGFEVNDRYRCFRHIFTLKSEERKRYTAEL